MGRMYGGAGGRVQKLFDGAVTRGAAGQLDVGPVPRLARLADDPEPAGFEAGHPSAEGGPPGASAPIPQIAVSDDQVQRPPGRVLGRDGEGESATPHQEIRLALGGPVRLHNRPARRAARSIRSKARCAAGSSEASDAIGFRTAAGKSPGRMVRS
ncbi:MAG: hypothetical protein H0V43_12655, partial [Gemmatimonadales bacterium]|nr:hypothetical protein [Gemmatimonadales bacterium]